MIIRHGYKTQKEAEEAATMLLWNDREQPGEMETTKEVRKDKDGKDVLFYGLEDTATGATAYISSYDDGEFNILFLSKDEANEDNRTYPFRGVPKWKLPFLMAVGVRTPLFKPTEYITPVAAQRYKGMVKLYSFFGEGENTGYRPYKELEGKINIDTAFDMWEDGYTDFHLTILPSELSDITGLDIKEASDYAKAIGSLLKAKLSKEQIKAVEDSYNFNNSDIFLRYAIYEFFRTEKYDRLKEVLAQYREFGLPEDWEKTSILDLRDKEETAERYVLARYLSRRNAEMAQIDESLKEIASYTGTPLPLLLRAYEHKDIYDF